MAGILGKGMSLEFGERRVFQRGLALLQSVLNITGSGFQAIERKPHFSYKGVDERLTVQEDPSQCGGPDHWEWSAFVPISASSQSKSLRDNKLLQLPAHHALGGSPGGLVAGEEEPGHATSRWDFFGAMT